MTSRGTFDRAVASDPRGPGLIISRWGAAIAQWIHLDLRSYCPGLKSQAHHLLFFQFILFKLYICHLNWNVKRTKINKKRPGLAHFFKKNCLQFLTTLR